MTVRVVSGRLWVDWDFNGVFTDESQYLISANGDMALSAFGAGLAGGGGMVSQANFTLRNVNGRFSPLRSDGALYSYIQAGKGYHVPVYFEVSIDGGSSYDRVFTGVLKLPSEDTLTTKELGTVTLDARSREEIYLQRRLSLTNAQFAAIHTGRMTEKDIISTYLQLAGVSGSDMTLDPGIFVIDWAWLDDESPIEECWALAAAGGGRLYADPDGEFRFESMAHWQTASRSRTSQLTLARANGGYGSLALRYDDSNLFNVVTVEAAPRSVGAVDVIWEPETMPVVEPQSTITLTARFDAPAYTISGIQFSAANGGGRDMTASVTITPTYYAQRADLQIANASNVRVHLNPLRILGTPVVGAPEVEESRNSTDHGQNAAFFASRGTRTKAIRGNPYVQSRAHAGTMAQMLLDQCEYPRLVATVRNAPGDPALRLSDRVTVTDAPTITGSLALIVTRIDWSYDVKFRQTIEGVDVTQLNRYDGEYFIVGTHAANGTARLFY